MSDDPRTRGPNADPSRTYPDHLLRDGRERGLSKADRRYLASEGGTVDHEGTDVNTRIRIRERIRESIIDFWLITEYLSDHDRDLIFRESDEQWDNWELQIGIKNAVQFFYGALEESDIADFPTMIESGIHDHARDQADGPVEVDVDFDVEVEQQFAITDALQKFKRGEPMTPIEIGALLVSGQVQDQETVNLLARHARTFGEIHASISPLLGQQLAKMWGDPEPYETFRYLSPGRDPVTDKIEPIDDVAYPDDFENLEGEVNHFEEVDDSYENQEWANERRNTEVTEKVSDVNFGPPEDPDEQDTPEAVFRKLSSEIDEPITVGERVVYEDGDRHLLDDEEGREGADSPADTDDDADGTEG
jgi:hypothetical protein